MMNKTLNWTLPGAIALAAAPAFADADNYGLYDGHMMGGLGHGWLGGFAMLAFWVIVIAVIVLAVRWIGDQRQSEQGPKALDILKQRLARGEIEPEEYEMRRKILES